MRDVLPWLTIALPLAPLAALAPAGRWRNRVVEPLAAFITLTLAATLFATAVARPGAASFSHSLAHSPAANLTVKLDRFGSTMALFLSGVSAVIAFSSRRTEDDETGSVSRSLSGAALLGLCVSPDALIAGWLALVAAVAAALATRSADRTAGWLSTQYLCAAFLLAAVNFGRGDSTADGSFLVGLREPRLASALWLIALFMRGLTPPPLQVESAADRAWLVVYTLVSPVLLGARIVGEIPDAAARSWLLLGVGALAVWHCVGGAFSDDRVKALRYTTAATANLLLLMLLRHAPGGASLAVAHCWAACGSLTVLSFMVGAAGVNSAWLRFAAGAALAGLPLVGSFWTFGLFYGQMDAWADASAKTGGIIVGLAGLGLVLAAGLLTAVVGGKFAADALLRRRATTENAAPFALWGAVLIGLSAGVPTLWAERCDLWLDDGRMEFHIMGAPAGALTGAEDVVDAAGFLEGRVWLLLAGGVGLAGGLLVWTERLPALVWTSDDDSRRRPLDFAARWIWRADLHGMEGGFSRGLTMLSARSRPAGGRVGGARAPALLTLVVCVLATALALLAVRWP